MCGKIGFCRSEGRSSSTACDHCCPVRLAIAGSARVTSSRRSFPLSGVHGVTQPGQIRAVTRFDTNGGGQSPAKRTIVAAATFTAEPIADAVRFLGRRARPAHRYSLRRLQPGVPGASRSEQPHVPELLGVSMSWHSAWRIGVKVRTFPGGQRTSAVRSRTSLPLPHRPRTVCRHLY